MSKIVLIDFDEKDRERLRAEGFDAELLAGRGRKAGPGTNLRRRSPRSSRAGLGSSVSSERAISSI
jgi:hypothetical protein